MKRGFQLEVPIVALSTVIGQSAIAVLKMSGKNLITKISPFFSVSYKLFSNPRQMIHGFFLDSDGNALDEIMMVVFPEPASYTGEDVIEIFLHGNMNISQDIIEVLLAVDFELALPGEFTYRAVMNGKLDLIQAEAVHELVTSKSSLGCRFSLRRLSGELTTYCETIYSNLVEIAACLRMHLDYPEQEIEVLPQFVFSDISDQLRILISNSQNMKRWQEGAKIVLVGAPNVGKSSLFNLFLGHNRALVSEIAGTTRDYLEEDIELLGHTIRLLDTAGIRKSHDTIEKMGINLSLSLLEEADLILCLLDQDNQQILQDIVPYKEKVLLVMNKSDLGHTRLQGVMAISVLKRHNIDELIQKIVQRLDFTHVQEHRHSLMLGSLRQKQLCEKAYQHILKVQENQAHGDLDIMSFHLQQAITYLAEFLGKMTNTDINNAMFGRFCLGK